MEKLLTCKNLHKTYGSKKALDGLDLMVYRGQIVGLLGPNGSGKTTLIKLLNGLLAPSDGVVEILGNSPGVESKKIVSYLPDKDFLPQHETIDSLINYYEDFYENFRRERALTMLSSLDISHNAKLKTLSKGNREKVALILVMSREAELYLLDEPIAGVDPATRDYILNTIIGNYNENAAILLCTHLIGDVETILSDIVFMDKGQIILSGNADEMRAREGKSIDTLFREMFSQIDIL